MPARRSSPTVLGTAVAAQCVAVADWLDAAAVGRWDAPSSHPGPTIADEARSMVASVSWPVGAVSAPPPSSPAMDAVELLRATSRAGVAIDEVDRTAALPDSLRAAGKRLSDAASGHAGGRLIATPHGAIRWDDLLATCCVEVAVRTRDLDSSLRTDGGGPPLDRIVLREAVTLLLQVLGRVAPGRSVEVRVPPYAAVQCVEGPRHTRGTPSNVVELDALTWLDLASGRRNWDEAVAAGSVRVSGTRADLGPWLPVL